MSGSPIFVSRLRGLRVVDANGDGVGKLRDVVVQTRTSGRPPRVRGLIVEHNRTRIFIPMTKVHSIDGAQVAVLGSLAEGDINLRRFDRRESETLVTEDLDGRRVERRNSETSQVIFDVAIQETREGEWDVSEVALREHRASRIGRRGQTSIVQWSDLAEVAADSEARDTESILAELADMKPADVATTLADLEGGRRLEVVESLDDDKLADVMEEMSDDDQIAILSALDLERAADILEEMDPDDAVDLVNQLPPVLAERLLSRMEPDEAEGVRVLMGYADETAGGLMTSEPVICPADATVADALARVRDEDITPALAGMVHVCRSPYETPTGRFLGPVHIQRLLREPPSTLVSELVDSELEPLHVGTGLDEVSRYFANYNLVNAPVVDDEHRLVGAITVDDVLDKILPEDWREHSRGGSHG